MIKIPLRNSSNVAVVDDEDFAHVAGLDWYEQRDPKSRTTYAAAEYQVAGGRKRKISMHRLVMRLFADPRTIDHADGDGLNNTRKNLRFATFQQNMANFPLRLDSTSNYKGVSFHRRTGLWRARTGAEGKIALGRYASRHEDALAYNLGAIALYGCYSRINTIDPNDLPTPERQAAIEQQVNRLLARNLTESRSVPPGDPNAPRVERIEGTITTPAEKNYDVYQRSGQES